MATDQNVYNQMIAYGVPRNIALALANVQFSAAQVADASTAVKGKVMLATSTDAVNGTDGTKAITPATLAAALSKYSPAAGGSNVSVVDNGNGTATISGSGLVDHGNGTATIG